MIDREKAIIYFKDMRKRLCEDYLNICPKNSSAYKATLAEKDFYDTAIKALEQEPCIQEKQANADKIDAVYIDGFKAGYSQARFDLEQEPCENCISRQAGLDAIARIGMRKCSTNEIEAVSECLRAVEALPPVTPQPKMGQWKRISMDKYVQHAMAYYRCSECGRNIIGTHNYCPSCGAKMQSVEEVEE